MNQPLSLPNSSLLQQLPTPIALLDYSFDFVGASLAWLKKFDLTEKEVLGRSIFEVFPSFSSDWTTKLNYALDGLTDIQIVDQSEFEKTEDPNFIWNLNPWTDSFGNNLGVALGVTDITEISKLKIALQKAKNELKEKGAIAKIGSWEYIVDSNQINLSPIVKSIFKLKDHQSLNLDDAICLYKEGPSRTNIKKVIKEAMEFGIPWNQNMQMSSVNGKELWVNTIGRPKFANGKCTRIIGTIQDITEKMIFPETPSQNSLLEKELFFSNSPSPMLVIDFSSGNILSVNDALTDLTRIPRQNLLNKTYKEFNVLPVNRVKTTILKQLKEKGSFKPFEFNFSFNKSLKLRLRVTGRAISNLDQKTIVICSITDVSSSYRKKIHLKQLLKESNEHVGEMVNFAHMVAHNLKAHATNFSLLFDFLSVEADEREREKMISILRQGNMSLSDTILGLREIVAIRENISIAKEHLALEESIYRTEQGLSGMIRQNKVKLINEIPENLKVFAIRPFLDNVLLNVISNAIKFRNGQKKPVIVLNAEVLNTYTVISIEDNGVGIDLTKNANKLFKLYSTVGNNIESRGMGLYLTNYQMKLMKGKIEVQSAIGEGSTFKLFFDNRP